MSRKRDSKGRFIKKTISLKDYEIVFDPTTMNAHELRRRRRRRV